MQFEQLPTTFVAERGGRTVSSMSMGIEDLDEPASVQCRCVPRTYENLTLIFTMVSARFRSSLLLSSPCPFTTLALCQGARALLPWSPLPSPSCRASNPYSSRGWDLLSRVSKELPSLHECPELPCFISPPYVLHFCLCIHAS